MNPFVYALPLLVLVAVLAAVVDSFTGDHLQRWLRQQVAAHRDKARVLPMLLVFVAFMAVVVYMNPAKVGLTAWGIARLGLGVYFGYWADRILFPYSRPHTLEGISRGAAEKRRSWIVVGCVVAAALLP